MNTQRRASSLVLVTLTMAAVSVVVLAGSSALIQSLRARSSLDSVNSAKALSEAALQEGLQRVRKAAGGTTLDAYGQYGIWNDTEATLTPARRGFTTQNSIACAQVVATNYSSDCGTYDLAVRSMVKAESYAYEAQDLPNAQRVVLVIAQGGNLGFTLATNPTYPAIRFDIELNDGTAWGGATANRTTFSVPNTARAMAITLRTNGANLAPTDDVLIATANGTAFAVQKGFTTIEGTGNAPSGAQYRSVMVIRPDFFPAPEEPEVDGEIVIDGEVEQGGEIVGEATEETMGSIARQQANIGTGMGEASPVDESEEIDGEAEPVADDPIIVGPPIGPDTPASEIWAPPGSNGTGGFPPGKPLIRRNISPTFTAAGFCTPYPEICR